MRDNARRTRSKQQWTSDRKPWPFRPRPITCDKGKYGPIYPKTPACYGFSILAKIIPGREPVFHEYAKNIEAAVKAQPDVLAPLKLHYLRWLLFPINGDTYFMYQGIFDTEFDKYTEDAVALFGARRRQDGVREPRGLSDGLADQPGRVRQICARAPGPEFP